MITNLLIASITNKYERIQETSLQEAQFHKTQLIYDLLNTSKSMPPPLNIVVLAFAFIIWILNLFILLIVPLLTNSILFHAVWNGTNTTKLNIFGYLHFELFEKMKDCNFCTCTIEPHRRSRNVKRKNSKYKWWYGCCSCWCSCCCFGKYCFDKYKWCYERCKSNNDEVPNSANDDVEFFDSILLRCKDSNHKEIKQSKYFQAMNLYDISNWYFGLILDRIYRILLYISILIGFFYTVYTGTDTIQKYIDQNRQNRLITVHHRGCNAVIGYKKAIENTKLNPVDGISMHQYFTKIEQHRDILLTSNDKQILNKISSNMYVYLF